MEKKAFFPYLPVISLFLYWLYACVAGALVSGDPRLLKLSFVSLPLAAGMALAAWKIRGKRGA